MAHPYRRSVCIPVCIPVCVCVCVCVFSGRRSITTERLDGGQRWNEACECVYMRVCVYVCVCHGGRAAVELNDNGGGCGRDMKPEHGSSKKKKKKEETKHKKTERRRGKVLGV